MATNKKQENKRRAITKEQAIEIADKYFLYCHKVALRDNISASNTSRGWQIVAITTPIILGMKTEITKFNIDMETGEVGAAITQTIIVEDVIEDALKEIDKRKDLDETKKAKINTKIEELEVSSNRTDRKKMDNLKKWFEKNTPYLKSIIDLITAILNR